MTTRRGVAGAGPWVLPNLWTLLALDARCDLSPAGSRRCDGANHGSLDGRFTEEDLEPSRETATMEFGGQLPVSCGTLDSGGDVIADPT
jgi:hypothetical protein